MISFAEASKIAGDTELSNSARCNEYQFAREHAPRRQDIIADTKFELKHSGEN